jgi:hypothetical protein
MRLIDFYLEYIQKNDESFSVDSFPQKQIIIKKKKRTIVSEQNTNDSYIMKNRRSILEVLENGY